MDMSVSSKLESKFGSNWIDWNAEEEDFMWMAGCEAFWLKTENFN